MITALAHARIVAADGVIEHGWIRFDEGGIIALGAGAAPSGAIDVHGALVTAGFVDLHCHGALGESFGESRSGTDRAIAHHRSAGTTTLIASVGTADIDTMVAHTELLADSADAGEIAGIHLEGPFLSHDHRGAHDPLKLREPNAAVLDRLLAAARGHVRIVTIAPELPGAMDLITTLVDRGVVVAVGHTSADAATASRAFDRGARLVTHLFNGMPSIHHRSPGPVAAALVDERVTVELIADGFHVHPLVIASVFAAAGASRTALITDASKATGLGDGTYGSITVVNSEARLANDSSLAGSVLTMSKAVQNALAQGIAVQSAVAAATSTPARLLGLDDSVGTLAPGRAADLVVLDDSGRAMRVYRGGVLVS